MLNGELFHQGEFWIPEMGQQFTKAQLFGEEYKAGTIFWSNTVVDSSAVRRHEQQYQTKKQIMRKVHPNPYVCLQADEYTFDQEYVRNKVILDGSEQPMNTFRILFFISEDLILQETYTVCDRDATGEDYGFCYDDRTYYMCSYEIRNKTNRIHRSGDRPAVAHFSNEYGLLTEKFYDNGLMHRDKGPAHVFMNTSGQESWGVEFYDRTRQHNQWGPQSLYFREIGLSCVHELQAYKYKLGNVRTIFKGVGMFGASDFMDVEQFIRYLADSDTALSEVSNGSIPEELQFDFQMRFGFDINEHIFQTSLRKADAMRHVAHNDTVVKSALQTLKDLL